MPTTTKHAEIVQMYLGIWCDLQHKVQVIAMPPHFYGFLDAEINSQASSDCNHVFV